MRKSTITKKHKHPIVKSTVARPVLIVTGISLSLLLIILGSYIYVQGERALFYASSAPPPQTAQEEIEPFPVGVNPRQKAISEDPSLEAFLQTNAMSTIVASHKASGIFRKLQRTLALFGWYQSLASLSSRILVIDSGERKEQIADHFGKILDWDEPMKQEFLDFITQKNPMIPDGTFFPGKYTVEKGATPETVALLITERFEREVLARYTDHVTAQVPLSDTLVLASLLEREAYDFTDMRKISGVIWNRLFSNMNLQIDATLQYAKGSNPSEPWWPRVLPEDKYIESVFNTYKQSGLPPTPISNPSLAAIIAALNPEKTDCMYYFHDKKSDFHCAPTYKEHVRLLKEYYGRGK